MRTGTPRAMSRSATRRPVLPVPPMTSVVLVGGVTTPGSRSATRWSLTDPTTSHSPRSPDPSATPSPPLPVRHPRPRRRHHPRHRTRHRPVNQHRSVPEMGTAGVATLRPRSAGCCWRPTRICPRAATKESPPAATAGRDDRLRRSQRLGGTALGGRAGSPEAADYPRVLSGGLALHIASELLGSGPTAQAHGEDRRASPPREGPALLQGMIICGRCGNRMTVRYHTRRDTIVPTYVCQRKGISTATPTCVSIPGDAVDRAVCALLLDTVTRSPSKSPSPCRPNWKPAPAKPIRPCNRAHGRVQPPFTRL